MENVLRDRSKLLLLQLSIRDQRECSAVTAAELTEYTNLVAQT